MCVLHIPVVVGLRYGRHVLRRVRSPPGSWPAYNNRDYWPQQGLLTTTGTIDPTGTSYYEWPLNLSSGLQKAEMMTIHKGLYTLRTCRHQKFHALHSSDMHIATGTCKKQPWRPNTVENSAVTWRQQQWPKQYSSGLKTITVAWRGSGRSPQQWPVTVVTCHSRVLYTATANVDHNSHLLTRGLLDISTCRQIYKLNTQAQGHFFNESILQKMCIHISLIFCMFTVYL